MLCYVLFVTIERFQICVWFHPINKFLSSFRAASTVLKKPSLQFQMFAVTVAERWLAKKYVPLSPASGHTLCITRSPSRIAYSCNGGSSDDDEPEDHDRSSQSIDWSLRGQEPSYSVFIENVPEEMCQFLEIIIETHGTVKEFKPDERNNGILVTFEEAEGLSMFSFYVFLLFNQHQLRMWIYECWMLNVADLLHWFISSVARSRLQFTHHYTLNLQ